MVQGFLVYCNLLIQASNFCAIILLEVENMCKQTIGAALVTGDTADPSQATHYLVGGH